jgi:hypothetical protein
VLRFQLRQLRELARARSMGEPEWGLLVEEAGFARRGRGVALVRLSRDAVDVLDAGWTSEGAREALFSGLRECCERARRDVLRAWPANLLHGLHPEVPRATALAMVAPLSSSVDLPPTGGRSDLALLDHI